MLHLREPRVIPVILLMMTAIAVIGPGLGKVIMVIALTRWVYDTRNVAGQALALLEVGLGFLGVGSPPPSRERT